jgi:2-polyprenyl-6-methoxyphenol hydroxylase-like FAD-dependent oxidoreductase
MYDAIIVGARCAGSPTAMLLARKGYKVLLVDKASFPSDTLSTHVIWPHGAEIMKRWGLLDTLAATNCPPIALNMIFDVGPFALKGAVTVANEGRGGFCPRRTVLDKLLVDAAVAAGAELREEFPVEDLVWSGDRVAGIKGRSKTGERVGERASIVIGADGANSVVAKATAAPTYDAIPPLGTFYYSYFSGFDADDVEQYVRDHQAAACFPTNGGLTLIVVVWPMYHFTCELARLEPPPPPLRALFAALHGNPEATNAFYAAITGAQPLQEFMNPENIARVVASAG